MTDFEKVAERILRDLIASTVRSAVEAEREACANLVESFDPPSEGVKMGLEFIARQIRMRGGAR